MCKLHKMSFLRCKISGSSQYQIDKKTGAKYAFESVSYWDKDKKQPRSKRKYLGKVDPETGEIIPSRGKVTHGADKAADDEEAVSALRDELEKKDKIISGLRKEMEELSARNEELLTVIRKIGTMVEGI